MIIMPTAGERKGDVTRLTAVPSSSQTRLLFAPRTMAQRVVDANCSASR